MNKCPCCTRSVPSDFIWVRPGAHEAWIAGEWVSINPIHADILCVLIAAGSEPISYNSLLTKVYGPSPIQMTTLYKHISEIRKKMRRKFDRSIIRTVTNFGYELQCARLRKETL